MLAPTEYEAPVRLIELHGARPLTSLKMYLSCYYLPNWYPLISERPKPEFFHVILTLRENLNPLLGESSSSKIT